ncbi:ChaN family lipoprotein [Rhodovibrionaceae bacterium A322]
MKRQIFSALVFALSALPLVSATAEPVGPSPFSWSAQIDRDHPAVGQVTFFPADGREGAEVLDAAGLDRLLLEAEVVLLGERHDHLDHHRLQAWVISRMADLGRRPTVAWEMLPQDRTAALKSYDGSAADLGKHLRWKEVWGDTWPAYQAIAEVALALEAPMVGADLTRAEKKRIGKEGVAALGPEEVERLGLNRPFLEGAQERLNETIAVSHCNMLPTVMLPIMSAVQKARDAAMADAILKAQQTHGSPVVLIAGNGHVVPDYAVGWYLGQRAPDLSVLALAFSEVSPGSEAKAEAGSPKNKGHFAPAVRWQTPVWDDEDPCVAFAESLKKMKKSAKE